MSQEWCEKPISFFDTSKACEGGHAFTLDADHNNAVATKVRSKNLMQASATANPAKSLFDHATEEQMPNPAMLLPLPLPG